MSHPIHPLDELAECYVFVKQSPEPLCCNRQTLREQVPSRTAAPLLPKLRGQFAEFLNVVSLAHHWASRPTYLCRFEVRSPDHHRLEAFLVSVASADSSRPWTRLPYGSRAMCRADFPTRRPTTFDRHFQSPARLASCVPPSLRSGGTGILTCCPSTTPFGLALGTD